MGSVYKCKYGHNVGHTVLLSFLHSFCFPTLFVVIFRCYFVVSVFFLFFFLGARPYAAIFFNVPAGGANGHGKEEEEVHNNNMENIATSEDN